MTDIIAQVEVASTIFDLLEGSTFAQTKEEELLVEEDAGKLRQDRYALRTSPQFLGPQVEDILTSLATLTQECNSSKATRVFFLLHCI